MQPNPQPGVAPATHRGPKFNALKHGLYAETLVLPEEDLAAFRRSRQLAFLEFRPQTVDEAELLDEMVNCRWQLKRCRPLQAKADEQTAHPERDAANRIAEPLTHQRTHTTMDVTVHRNRIDKLESRLRDKLFVSQKQRRLGLMAGAVNLPPHCYMETDGEVVQVVDSPRLPTRVCQVTDVLPQAVVPMQDQEVQPDKSVATPSTDKRDGFLEEQKKIGGEAPQEIAQRDLQRNEAKFPGAPSRGRWIGGFGARQMSPGGSAPDVLGMDGVREQMTWVGSA